MKEDREIIRELEETIGKSIPIVKEINYHPLFFENKNIDIGVKFDGKRVSSLNLKGGWRIGRLENLPEPVLNLRNLRELNLAGNRLRILPKSFGKLKSLERL
ncbi:MAG: hypothetical protein GF329_11630 [Candidatus Lokiarchaeota archaeon]|nr:hypothetical protein [Candidatus Lokiarchaeota archaeon]